MFLLGLDLKVILFRMVSTRGRGVVSFCKINITPFLLHLLCVRIVLIKLTISRVCFAFDWLMFVCKCAKLWQSYRRENLRDLWGQKVGKHRLHTRLGRRWILESYQNWFHRTLSWDHWFLHKTTYSKAIARWVQLCFSRQPNNP